MSIEEPTGERGHFRFNKETGKFEEFDPALERQRMVRTHFVITDDIAPTLSHATTDGSYFTSKQKLREHYKANGCIETGGKLEPRGPRRPSTAEIERKRQEMRDEIAKSMNAVKYGMAPLTEKEKQRAIEEKRQWEAYQKRQR